MPPSSSLKTGILSLPGADAASKAAAERLLEKDFNEHHCYFELKGLHNHLSHHILTAFDLGASASLLETIYDEESKIQLPIDLNEGGVVPKGITKPGEITEENWMKWLGDPLAYSAYVAFFSERLAALGVIRTLEVYIFSPAANESGAYMLYRLFSGVLHPFIQVGFGLEFGNEIEVVAGLASAAIHPADAELHVPSGAEILDANTPGENETPPKGMSILGLLRKIYDSPQLTPLPYEPDVFILDRIADLAKRDGGSRIPALKSITAQFDLGDTHEALDALVEQLMFASTLLAFATGRKDREPRVDFYLVHLLTSALAVPAFFKQILSVEDKRALLRPLLQQWGLTVLSRGRPRIDAALLMSYTDRPAPPGSSTVSVDPWATIVADVLHAPDSHTLKTVRALLYGAVTYGAARKGGVVGACGRDGEETHQGVAGVDGTVFVRAAGMLMGRMGWVTHGQDAAEWDRSGLGWDEAWEVGK